MKIFDFMILVGSFCVIALGAIESSPEKQTKNLSGKTQEPKSVRELSFEIAPKYGIPLEVVQVILDKESSGGHKLDVVRFEPGQIDRARKIAKTTNPDQLRAYASSHCPWQVMGWHMPLVGMSWADLYNAETCVEMGSKILANCYSQAPDKGSYQKTYQAFKCYNGSDAYARDAMQRLSLIAIEKLLKS